MSVDDVIGSIKLILFFSAIPVSILYFMFGLEWKKAITIGIIFGSIPLLILYYIIFKIVNIRNPDINKKEDIPE